MWGLSLDGRAGRFVAMLTALKALHRLIYENQLEVKFEPVIPSRRLRPTSSCGWEGVYDPTPLIGGSLKRLTTREAIIVCVLSSFYLAKIESKIIIR